MYLCSVYGPAVATAIPKPHNLLLHLNPDWFYLSGTGLPVCPGKEVIKCVVVVIVVFYSDLRSIRNCCRVISC